MAIEKKYPPLDGSLDVLPGFVDFQATHNPNLPWAKFPSIHDPTQATAISYAEMAKATHRVAHVVRPDRAGKEGEIVGILVNCDTVSYLALMIGMVRAGLKPFPMSPRNSAEAVVNMLEKTNCHRMITQSSLPPSLISSIQSQLSDKGFALHLDEIPSLESIFPAIKTEDPNVSPDVPTYPPPPVPFHPDDVVLYLHSSGSTGFPKPIAQTQNMLLQWCHSPNLIEGKKRQVAWGGAMLPSFHTMGIFMQLYAPLMSSQFIGVYTPNGPAPPVVPNPHNTLETSRVTGCHGIPVVPSFIEVWANSPEDVKYLATLSLLSFAGGPLSAANGAKLTAAGVHLCAIYGATEAGSTTRTFDTDDSQGLDADVKTTADWAWMQFGDHVKIRWVPQGDGSYELVYLTCETHQPAIENLPNERGYATSDLWEPHPKKKNLWRIVGRTDDVLVLGSGEKVVPIPQESHIGSVSFIAGAVMFGRGKSQVGVIVEPRPEAAIDTKDEKAVAEFRNMIWSYVEEANKPAPTFARIFKEMILIAEPAKPFARAGKGTIIRKMVLATYEEEIEQLYKTIEESTDAKGISPPKSWNAKDIEAWLVEHAASINHGSRPHPSVDLFEQGFDSLSATYLRNRLIGALRNSSEDSVREASFKISQEFIFEHPTIQLLSSAIVSLINGNVNGGSPNNFSGAEAIQYLIEGYTTGFPAPKSSAKSSDDVVVVLTGSTGALGSHILASLLADDKVTKVYTLDRTAADQTVQGRQNESFEDRGLDTSLLESSKLSVLTGSLVQKDFALSKGALDELSTSVTHIIHNAWRLDFNLTLPSFESLVASTRNLIDFASAAEHQVKFLYTSSVSVASGWKHGKVPESVLSDASVTGMAGYGASKFVVEHVLAEATKHGLLSGTSLRIGQICGSTTTGAWNTTDWVPIIVKSSLTLKCFPDLEGTVSWLPMDVTANTIRDIVLSSSPTPEVVNLVHPHPVPWTSIFTTIKTVLGTDLPLIPFPEWVAKVEALSAGAGADDLQSLPAIKLLSFLKGFGSAREGEERDAGGSPKFETTKAETASETLRSAESVNEKCVALWIDYWRKKGFLG